jgi:hypothetical protein
MVAAEDAEAAEWFSLLPLLPLRDPIFLGIRDPFFRHRRAGLYTVYSRTPVSRHLLRLLMMHPFSAPRPPIFA